MRRLFAVAAATAASLAGTGPAAAAEPKPLTFEALRALVSVREPQISPDGQRIVYVRAAGDFKADRYDTELVLVDVASGARGILPTPGELFAHVGFIVTRMARRLEHRGILRPAPYGGAMHQGRQGRDQVDAVFMSFVMTPNDARSAP